MIGLKIAAGWLELKPGTITLDISSPLFSSDTVPGTISYPFALPLSPANVQRLNFPHLRAEQGERVADEPCQFYIDGVLRWVGALVYLDCDEASQLYEYHFVADAADLQSRIAGVRLPTLDLGRVPLVLAPFTDDYALPCVRNAAFYGEKVPAYAQVLNYYRQGAYQLNPGGKRAPIVPFPRLVPLLRRVLGAFGYALTGSWLDDADVLSLLVYSDRAAEDAAGNLLGEFALNRHVPDLEVGELLVALQQLFGLAYQFHPVRRELRITPLREIIADPAYVPRTGGPARTTAVTADGFTLKMGLEQNDELNKTLDTSWAQFVVGAGKQEISTSAGTLHVVREADPLDAARGWQVPAVEVKGGSPAFELGDESKCGLRLLFYRGLAPDSQNQPYPQASWGYRTYFDAQVGQATLHWAGPGGLYERWHAGWLAFLSRAATKERTMQFRVADLLALDPARKELVDFRKYLWEKVSLSVSTTGSRLETARFTYRYTRL